MEVKRKTNESMITLNAEEVAKLSIADLEVIIKLTKRIRNKAMSDYKRSCYDDVARLIGDELRDRIEKLVIETVEPTTIT
jgi:hypothetical protein